MDDSTRTDSPLASGNEVCLDNDARIAALEAAEDAHLVALNRRIDEDFAGPLLRCFNHCVDDQCVLAVEVTRGVLQIGTSTPAIIERAARHDNVLPSEKIDELVNDLRDRPPTMRWLVIRSITGSVAARLLCRKGASA